MKALVQTVVMISALSVVLASNGYADNLMAMRWFSQLDTWREDPMGSSGNTIGSDGCVITCVAMAMNYFGISTDPDQFNQWLSENQGYDDIGQLNWDKIDDYTNGVVYYGGRIDGVVDNDRLNQELDSGYPVVLHLSAYGGHFILAVGRIGSTYYIVDPLDYPARLTTLAESYGSYSGMRLLRGPARTNLVGYQNGWDSTVAPLFVDCYGYNGGQQTFGQPVARTIDGQLRPDTVWTDWWRCYTQVFDGGDLGECAIVYDFGAGVSQAFPIHGQLWNYYKNHGGSFILLGGNYIGGPVDQERYATSNTTGHQLVVQKMANGYLVYDAVTGLADAVSDDSGFHIAIIPGDGSTLTLWANALTTTSVYLTISQVTGAVEYWFYRNGQFIASLPASSALELTDTDLAPNTSYSYQALAVDASGTVLAESSVVTVTTPAESAPEGLNLTLLAHSTSIDVSWPLVNQANSYQVFLNGNYHGSTSSWSYAITGLATSVTYTIRVEAYNNQGELLASGTNSVQTGQTVSIYATGYPSVLYPNQIFTIEFWGSNNTDDPIYDFVLQYCTIESNYPSWMTVEPIVFTPPDWVNPRSTVKLATVTVTTGNFYPPATTVFVTLRLEANCQLPSLGLNHLSRFGYAEMAVAPFVDLVTTVSSAFVVYDQNQMAYLQALLENDANSTAPSCRLEIEVDGEVMVSVLTPQLSARQTWSASLPLGIHQVGDHQVRLVVDAANELVESREDNNEVFTTLRVLPDEVCDLAITNLTVTPVEVHVGQTATVSCRVDNLDVVASPETTLVISFGLEERVVAVPALNPGQSVTLSQEFSLATETAMTVTVTVDPDHVAFERVLDNNQTSISVAVGARLQPNLTITASGGMVTPIEPVVLQLSVTNNGPGAAAAGTVTARDQVGWELGQVSLPALASGESFDFTFDLGCRPLGTHQFQVIVDEADAIAETDETDNSQAVAVTAAIMDLPDQAMASWPIIADVEVYVNDQVNTQQDPLLPQVVTAMRPDLGINGRRNGVLYGFTPISSLSGKRITKATLWVRLESQNEREDNYLWLSLLSGTLDPNDADWQMLATALETGRTATFVPSFYPDLPWHQQTGPVDVWIGFDCTAMIQLVVDGKVPWSGLGLVDQGLVNRDENQLLSWSSLESANPDWRPQLIIAYEVDRPDLTVSLTLPESGSVIAGQATVGSGAVANLGRVAAGPVTVTIAGGDFSWSVECPGVAAGQTWPFNFDLLIGQIGDYALTATVDSAIQVFERDETNNRYQIAVTVLPPPKPNLTVNGLAVQPSQLRVGQAATVNWQEFNLGDADALAHQTTVSFGSQSQTVSVPAIPIGGSQSLSYVFSLIDEGEALAAVEADSSNQVAESDESDNLGRITVTVLPPLKADLHGTLQLSPASPREGDLVSVTATVWNSDDAAAGAHQVNLSFGGQTAAKTASGVASGSSYTVSESFVAPSAGAQTALVEIDVGNAVLESDETNNSVAITVTVSPPLRPDLVVSSINAYLQRGRLMVEVAVGNVGEAQAGYFQLQLVLVESGKTLVVSFDGLAAGASAKKAFALGRYRRSLATFRATVDSGNLIVESDETNNLLVVSKQL